MQSFNFLDEITFKGHNALYIGVSNLTGSTLIQFRNSRIGWSYKGNSSGMSKELNNKVICFGLTENLWWIDRYNINT